MCCCAWAQNCLCREWGVLWVDESGAWGRQGSGGREGKEMGMGLPPCRVPLLALPSQGLPRGLWQLFFHQVITSCTHPSHPPTQDTHIQNKTSHTEPCGPHIAMGGGASKSDIRSESTHPPTHPPTNPTHPQPTQPTTQPTHNPTQPHQPKPKPTHLLNPNPHQKKKTRSPQAIDLMNQCSEEGRKELDAVLKRVQRMKEAYLHDKTQLPYGLKENPEVDELVRLPPTHPPTWRVQSSIAFNPPTHPPNSAMPSPARFCWVTWVGLASPMPLLALSLATM